MISAIIPTYRNPKYLDLCLKSATENKVLSESEIIVVIDGYTNESMPVIEKYEGVSVIPLDQNHGMQYALNIGVMNATQPLVFILNDDNVFPRRWDQRIAAANTGDDDAVVTINQVEPNPSIFNFQLNPRLGSNADTFRYDEWLTYEEQIACEQYTLDGRLFPFVISKRWYMAVGGFDTFYKSPFWTDVDFWLKLELANQLKFVRYHGCHLFHFASVATKKRTDMDGEKFRASETFAAAQFQYKWGYIPDIVANVQRNNTKFPLDKTVRGIRFQ